MLKKLKCLSLAMLLSGCAATTPVSETQTPDYLSRTVQDEVFYFVLPDRFYNGDTSNDQGSKTVAISQGGFDKTRKSWYHGGDVRGLMDKLDYIQQMGVTAIWLTPILRNQAIQGEDTGYHGYWVLDFTQIDPHLGSNDDLKAFIDASHAKGMKVYFDIITNHTADVIKLTECHGEDGSGWSTTATPCPYRSLAEVAAGKGYTTVVPEASKDVKSPAWLNDPKYYHNQGDSTFQGENSLYGDFFGLDDIDTDNPEVVTGLIDVFKDIVTKFKPDGFRVDTVKHVNMEFWQQFSPALMNHAQSIGIPNFIMFGEVYSGDPDVLSSYTTTGKLPSVLDFGFQGAVYDSIVAGRGNGALKRLFDNDYKYKDEDSDANQLLNFIGNHDMGRIGYFLANEEFGYGLDEKLKRSRLGHALMFFARGVPVIYYGDEQGFTGDGGDHGARQDMMPSKVASYIDDVQLGTSQTPAADNFDTNHVLYRDFRTFADIYKQHQGLRYGEHATVFADEKPGIFAFTRTLFDTDEEYFMVFNTSTVSQSYNLPSSDYEAVYIGAEGKLSGGTINISGLDFVVLKRK